MADKLIAGGAWLQIKVELDDGKLYSLGLATSASYDEDWGIQPANVIGHLGPVDYDSQNYSCVINIGTLVPETKDSISLLPDGGEITMNDMIPTRDEIQLNGKGKLFPIMQFVNIATQEIMNQFADVILASNGSNASPNAYITNNMRFNSVKRTI